MLDTPDSDRRWTPAVVADTVAGPVDAAGTVLGAGSCRKILETERALGSLVVGGIW